MLHHIPWISFIILLFGIGSFVFCELHFSTMSKSELLLRVHMRGREGMYDNPEDYEYEIIKGHPKRDIEKFERQRGCACYEHYYDPHCGSDMKIYDNGCFFMCAQSKNPDLKLHRWGTCNAKDDSGSGGIGNIPSKLVEMDFDFESDV